VYVIHLSCPIDLFGTKVSSEEAHLDDGTDFDAAFFSFFLGRHSYCGIEVLSISDQTFLVMEVFFPSSFLPWLVIRDFMSLCP